MAKAPEPTVTAEDIVFELERFELSGGNKLQLAGRWFGVRGRRFVRPTLTVGADGERARALADLDDKPWAAEDGEPWRASFPWRKGVRMRASELSVAPDITIQLPAPSPRLKGSKRLAAVPRRDAMTASWGDLAAAIEAPAEPEEIAAPEVQAVPEPELEAATDQVVEDLRAELAEAQRQLEQRSRELESARGELESARGERASARGELESARGELDSARGEVAAAEAAREAALRSAAQAEAERDSVLSRAEEAEAERDSVLSRVEEAEAERDHALASRGAALVMRRATQAAPAYEHQVGWGRRLLAAVVLLAIICAALIVLNVL